MLNYMNRKEGKIKNKIKCKRQMKIKFIKQSYSSVHRYNKAGI